MFSAILLIAALVLFVCAAFGVAPRGVSLGWLGLACWVGSLLLKGGPW